MAKARILLVEDEYLVAAELEAALAEFGYETVGIASDFEAALRLADRELDVALVDIHLRDGRTGLDIAQILAKRHGVAVLLLTANPRMALEAQADGVAGVLSKPCAEDLIVDALEYVLEARRGERRSSPPGGLMLLDF